MISYNISLIHLRKYQPYNSFRVLAGQMVQCWKYAIIYVRLRTARQMGKLSRATYMQYRSLRKQF